MIRRITAIAAATILGGLLLGATPAHAAKADDCRTVTSNLVNRPDSGNHGTWAADTAVRTVVICHIPTPEATLSETEKFAVPVEGWLYSAKLTDKGTFVTLPGAHLSPNDGHALIGDNPGVFEGGFTTIFAAPADWQFWGGDAYDGHTFTGAPGGQNPSTGAWVTKMFSDGYIGPENNVGKDWSWTYRTCNEQWVDGVETDAGTTNAAGDITGYPFTFIHRSKVFLPCYAVGFVDECDGYKATLSNPSVNEKSSAVFDVNGVLYKVAGDDAVVVQFATDVKVTVKAKSKDSPWVHEWKQPLGCATPTPSPQPSSSEGPPPAAGLPQTGPSLTLPILGGAVFLVAGAGLAVWAVRVRRRDGLNGI